jgi:putative chitinase
MNALQELQQAAGVKPDGIFGPATFKAASALLGLSGPKAVHFFAQCAHETGGFKLFEENLNYSAKALHLVFHKYFPDMVTAEAYARKPEAIANRAYGNRMGNGPEESGDGWKFRGRGALQLTGRNNYQLFSAFVNDETLLQDPEPVAGKYAFQSAIYFFEKNRLWSICAQGLDVETITKLTKRINGGTNGLAHRIELTKKYEKYT